LTDSIEGIVRYGSGELLQDWIDELKRRKIQIKPSYNSIVSTLRLNRVQQFLLLSQIFDFQELKPERLTLLVEKATTHFNPQFAGVIRNRIANTAPPGILSTIQKYLSKHPDNSQQSRSVPNTRRMSKRS